MSMSLTIDFNKPLPVFPLPSCVLLPHATVPLHIFEPRYRQMTQDALAGNRLITMAMFDGPAWKQDYKASPPIREHVCVGYIVQHNDLPGGRYNILLQGLCRAMVVEEMRDDSLPYRQAVVHPTEIDQPVEVDMIDERQAIVGLLDDPLLKQLTAVNSIHQWLSDDIQTASLVDLGVMTLCEESETRYELLKESDLYVRAQRFIDILKSTRKTMRLADRFAPRELTDHMHLN